MYNHNSEVTQNNVLQSFQGVSIFCPKYSFEDEIYEKDSMIKRILLKIIKR